MIGSGVSVSAGGTGTYADPSTGQVYGAPATAPWVRTEPRSYLGLYAVSLAAVVGGVLALLVVLGADIPAVVVWAAMLAVVAGGLLIGAITYYFSPEYTDVGYQPEQPVPYSHRLHAGEMQIGALIAFLSYLIQLLMSR